MSALGHKRTFELVPAMSALPPKADIAQRQIRVTVALDSRINSASVRRSAKACFV
jgi:hypothetical protein